MKATPTSKQRANTVLIEPYGGYKHDTHRFASLNQCFSSDFLNNSEDTFIASRLAKTTISILAKPCCILKLSRIVRLIAFLYTAFFIFFLAIAKPKRGWSKLFFLAKSVKYWSLDFTGLSKTFLYSAGFFNRTSVGNPQPLSTIQARDMAKQLI